MGMGTNNTSRGQQKSFPSDLGENPLKIKKARKRQKAQLYFFLTYRLCLF